MNHDLQAYCKCINDPLHPKCNFSGDDYFLKDIYYPKYYNVPAICATVLSAALFLVLCKSLSNLRKIYILRRQQLSILHVSIMNLLVFGAVFTLLLYTLDGPIQLIFGGDGFSGNAIAKLSVLTVCFFQYTLAYSSYTWVKLICVYREKWGNNLTTKFIKMFLFADVILISCLIPLNFLPAQTAFEITVVALSVLTIINGIVFSISCYILAANLREIYDFDPRRRTKITMLRAFAIMTAIIGILRIANEISNFIILEWQYYYKLKNYCEKKPYGALYLVLYVLFVDILPQFLFFILFSPESKQKTQGRSQTEEYDFNDYDSENDEEEDRRNRTEPLRSRGDK